MYDIKSLIVTYYSVIFLITCKFALNYFKGNAKRSLIIWNMIGLFVCIVMTMIARTSVLTCIFLTMAILLMSKMLMLSNHSRASIFSARSLLLHSIFAPICLIVFFKYGNIVSIHSSVVLIVLCVLSGMPPYHKWFINSLHTDNLSLAVLNSAFMSIGSLLVIKYYSQFVHDEVGMYILFGLSCIGVMFSYLFSLLQSNNSLYLSSSTMLSNSMTMLFISLGLLNYAVMNIVFHGIVILYKSLYKSTRLSVTNVEVSINPKIYFAPFLLYIALILKLYFNSITIIVITVCSMHTAHNIFLQFCKRNRWSIYNAFIKFKNILISNLFLATILVAANYVFDLFLHQKLLNLFSDQDFQVTNSINLRTFISLLFILVLAKLVKYLITVRKTNYTTFAKLRFKLLVKLVNFGYPSITVTSN